jgi:hypothetical protein
VGKLTHHLDDDLLLMVPFGNGLFAAIGRRRDFRGLVDGVTNQGPLLVAGAWRPCFVF